MEKPKLELLFMTSVGVSEEGHIAIRKEYSNGRVEQVIFEDMFEIEQLLDELSDLIPGETCPVCGERMSTFFVKKYDCETCQIRYDEDMLEIMRASAGARNE